MVFRIVGICNKLTNNLFAGCMVMSRYEMAAGTIGFGGCMEICATTKFNGS
jgi:hypothetical protein